MKQKILIGFLILSLAIMSLGWNFNSGGLKDRTDGSDVWGVATTSIDTSVVIEMSRFKTISIGYKVTNAGVILLSIYFYESIDGVNWLSSDSTATIIDTNQRMRVMTRTYGAPYGMFIVKGWVGNTNSTMAISIFTQE